MEILIPQSDLETLFARLPAGVKTELRLWAAAFAEIGKAKTGLHLLYAHWGRRIGCSASRVRAKFSAWRNGTERYEAGDWRILVNHAKAGPEWWGETRIARIGGERKEFLEFWKGLCEDNQRKCKPAYRVLIRRWKNWRLGDERCAIPGYQECPEPAEGSEVPEGWSYKNLMRYRPNDFELRAARIGRAAASEERLQVFTTRAGLKVGEFYMFDDLEFDLKVNFAGQSRAMRPKMLAALDVFSGCDFAQGFKPTLWEAATTDEHGSTRMGTKRGLKEADMMWLVVSVLTMHGYRTDERGTTLVVEHGTAAIRSDFEERIKAVTQGKVRIARSGIFNKASFAGLWEPRGKGNFRFKANRESLFNLWHNELAALPGQVGMDRDHCPEQMHGLERYNERLLQAAALLPPEKAALVQFPVLEWNQWLDCALTALSNINGRTEHELEGWEASHLVVSEWRLNLESPWLPATTFLALPAPEQALARALLNTNPHLSRVRKLSPAEVWSSGRGELQRLPAWRFPELVGLKEGRPLKVTRGLFEFQDQEISPDKLRFRAEARLGNRVTPLEDERELYLCFVNPFDPRVLVACWPDGSVIGECPLWEAPCRNDLDRIKERLGAAMKWESEALAKIGLRHTDRAVIKAEMHAANACLIGAAPVGKGQPRIDTDEHGLKVGADAFEKLEGVESEERVESGGQEAAMDELG